jgi:hypothetical protein
LIDQTNELLTEDNSLLRGSDDGAIDDVADSNDEIFSAAYFKIAYLRTFEGLFLYCPVSSNGGICASMRTMHSSPDHDLLSAPQKTAHHRGCTAFFSPELHDSFQLTMKSLRNRCFLCEVICWCRHKRGEATALTEETPLNFLMTRIADPYLVKDGLPRSSLYKSVVEYYFYYPSSVEIVKSPSVCSSGRSAQSSLTHATSP